MSDFTDIAEAFRKAEGNVIGLDDAREKRERRRLESRPVICTAWAVILAGLAAFWFAVFSWVARVIS